MGVISRPPPESLPWENVPPKMLYTIQLLLKAGNTKLTTADCHEIADYLILIHDKYRAFHNGGHSRSMLGLGLLARPPSVPEDIEPIPPLGPDGQMPFKLRLHMTQVLGHAVKQTILHLEQLANLCNMEPNPALEGYNPLYRMFHLHHVPYLEEAEAAKNLSYLDQVFDNISHAEAAVAETQLWVAFMPMLCGLLACVAQAPAEVSQFQVENFQYNRVAVKAHNWYMGMIDAPHPLYAIPKH